MCGPRDPSVSMTSPSRSPTSPWSRDASRTIATRIHRGRSSIIEVAESSLAGDRERKGSLYARAGLPDYWILNLEESKLEVYREPAADPSAPFGWRYARRQVFGSTAQASPLAAPAATIRVIDLLP